MRHLWLCALLLLAGAAGCTRSNLSIDGDGGDCPGCTGDLAGLHDGGSRDGAIDMRRHRDMTQPPGVDLAGPKVCTPTCGQCFGGGACCPGAPNGCCAAGEWCDNGQCRCGDHDACTNGNICATGGPIGPGADSCGIICCGTPNNPCPL